MKNTYVYFDFEYQDAQVLMCFADVVSGGKTVTNYFDLRDNKDTALLSQFIKDNENSIFVSYALNAEINSLLRLGIDVTNLKGVDLMVESRMITMSHDRYFEKTGSMLGSVSVLLGDDVSDAVKNKDAMRDLILDNAEWTDEEWEKIGEYCYSDIEVLPRLFKKIQEIHVAENHPYHLSHVLKRADYVRKTTEMDFASKGFPVGQDFENIYKYKNALKSSIIESLPPIWRLCYEYTEDKDKWTRKGAELVKVIEFNNWQDVWKRTPSGRGYSMEVDYLEKLEVKIPAVESLRRAVRSLNTLNSKDLREDVVNGYVKPSTFGFSAKTGRNGLKPKRGYLFNLPSWMRRSVHPHEGMNIIGSDWSQQEIAIAAKLSGDEELVKAYKSGDVYLALGKMSGAIPQDGTKKSHFKQRAIFKILQLGLQYGKGQKSIALDFYNMLKDEGWTMREASMQASDVYKWHKQYFNTYWTWIEAKVKQSKQQGWIETSDNWVCFVGKKTLKTQLLNFPSQSGGAAMMRTATFKLYDYWKLGLIDPLLCTQHDATYFNAADEGLDDKVMIIHDVMEQIGLDTIGLKVGADTHVYTHETGYMPDKWDDNDEKIWNMVRTLAEQDEEEI